MKQHIIYISTPHIIKASSLKLF